MTMMDVELNSWLLFTHAREHFSDVEVVSLEAKGKHRYTYGDFAKRAQQLMHALDRLDVPRGARVATLAFNHYRHLECYFAIPCTERVLHTLNVRLSPEELGYIIQHAEDQVIFVDPELVPLLEKVGAPLRGVRHIVVLGTVPPSSLERLVGYEDLIAGESTEYPERHIPERTPLGLCYTSGTTGRPRGVVYTHRSTYLHSLAATSAAAAGIGPQDTVLPVVPMFHANAWGVPFAATAVGAKQVLAGSRNDGDSLVDLLAEEKVTITLGVPTVWFAVAENILRRGVKLPHLRYVLCGGSQPPPSLIERFVKELEIPFIQAWGMTETSPIGSVSWPKQTMVGWSEDRLAAPVRRQAGIPTPCVDIRIRTDDGRPVPRDGKSMGNLEVRGPWVASSYWKSEKSDEHDRWTEDGWFKTGDVAVGSKEGYFVIADRTKDLIKSGGEWISSVDMEAALMSMPDVVEAAVIAVPDPKWQERPVACIVPRKDKTVTLDALREHLGSHGFAKWQLPDRMEIITSVPRTAVGKFDKRALRARFVGTTPAE